MNIRKTDEVFRVPARAWGNSLGIVIPHRSAKRLGIKKDDDILVIIPKQE